MSAAGIIYGEFTIGEPPVPMVDADRILGARVLSDAQRRVEWVDIQFQSAGSGLHQLRLDYPSALFLLSCLKSIQLDVGTPFPDDPRK